MMPGNLRPGQALDLRRIFGAKLREVFGGTNLDGSYFARGAK